MSELAQVLRSLLPVDDARALVDASTGDDAAVYKLSEDRALVVTVDFFTPIVDDPYDFGRIGAANAVSDVYAMGARPLLALNLVGFPRSLLGQGILEEIIRGGAETLRTADIPVLGGHTIDDAEPKFGVVVVGEVHPDQIVTNAGAQPGDDLILTKALGTGVIATAHKNDVVSDDVLQAAVASMVALNDRAARVMTEGVVHGATDVTGYGLLGHLRNMLRQSRVSANIIAHDVPILDGAIGLLESGQVPGGTKRNRADLATDVEYDEGVSESLRMMLCDAQTSGGLLMAVPPGESARIVTELGLPVSTIGTVTEGSAGTVRVLQ